jgi:hypothetical protein
MSEEDFDADAPRDTGNPVQHVESWDPLENLTGDDVDEVMQTRYSPPDREPRSMRSVPTRSEERAGLDLDEWLDQEEADLDPGAAAADEPDPRAGRLVAPDEGVQPDDEADEVASDRGPAGYAASAEEAAVHVVDPDDLG